MITITEEEDHCPVCGKFLHEYESFGGVGKKKCRGCNLLFSVGGAETPKAERSIPYEEAMDRYHSIWD